MPRQSRTIYLLRRAQLAIQAQLEERLSPLGLTPTQFTVLSLSDRGGEGLSSAQLSRRAGVSSQSMNEIVGALERKGLIERAEASENRRILRARLTVQGRRLLSETDAIVDALEASLFVGVKEAELAALRTILERLLPARKDGP